MKALYWRYDSCPQEEEHVVDGVCTGWCVLEWYRLFSGNLGKPKYRTNSILPVPFGIGEEPDKRRGGTWYLGVQALDELATYSLTTGYRAPEQSHAGGCDRLDRYCVIPNRTLQLRHSAAAPRARRARHAAALLLAGVAGASWLVLVSRQRVDR